jgi:hypothetical protein
LETLVKVIGFLSLARTPEIKTSSMDLTESLGCSCAFKAKGKRQKVVSDKLFLNKYIIRKKIRIKGVITLG